jgi:hypothetical protein
VSLRDVPATVVDLLGLEPGAPFTGRTLARYWSAASGTPTHFLTSDPLVIETGTPLHLANQGREPAAKGPMTSLIAAGMHYIRSADGREELYRLATDPEEQVDLAGSPAAGFTLERFRQELRSLFKAR